MTEYRDPYQELNDSLEELEEVSEEAQTFIREYSKDVKDAAEALKRRQQFERDVNYLRKRYE